MARAKPTGLVRTPKAPVFKKPKRDPADDPDTRPCWACKTRRKMGQFQFVMSSMLDPTAYACSPRCLTLWRTEHPPETWPTRNTAGNCA